MVPVSDRWWARAAHSPDSLILLWVTHANAFASYWIPLRGISFTVGQLDLNSRKVSLVEVIVVQLDYRLEVLR